MAIGQCLGKEGRKAVEWQTGHCLVQHPPPPPSASLPPCLPALPAYQLNSCLQAMKHIMYVKHNTTFMTRAHLWPHSIEYTWPIFNALALDPDLRHIAVVEYPHRSPNGQQYFKDFLDAVAAYFSATLFTYPGGFHASFIWRPGVCLEKVIVAAKLPHPHNLDVCSGAFMSRHVVRQHKLPFLHFLYQKARAAVSLGQLSHFPPEYPEAAPWKVLFVNRKADRVLENQAEVVNMIASLGIPVQVVYAEDLSFYQQVCLYQPCALCAQCAPPLRPPLPPCVHGGWCTSD